MYRGVIGLKIQTFPISAIDAKTIARSVLAANPPASAAGSPLLSLPMR